MEDRLEAFQEANTLSPSDPQIVLFGTYSSKLKTSVYTKPDMNACSNVIPGGQNLESNQGVPQQVRDGQIVVRPAGASLRDERQVSSLLPHTRSPGWIPSTAKTRKEKEGETEIKATKLCKAAEELLVPK